MSKLASLRHSGSRSYPSSTATFLPVSRSLSLEDLKEIGLMLDTLRNRKQAEIKASTKGGAKGATATKAKAKKAGSLMVERDEIAAYDDIATDFSGGGAAKAGEWKVDDGDFM